MRTWNSSFWIVLLGRGLQILLGMVSLRALSTFLPTAELGYFYLITAVVSWFGLVLMNPVGMYSNRKANQWLREKTLGTAWLALLIYAGLLALLSIPIVLLLDSVFRFSLDHSTLLVISVVLQIAITGFGTTVLSLLNLTYSRAVYIPVAVFVQFLSLALAVLLVQYIEPAAWLWLLGVAGANVFGAALALFIFKREDRDSMGVFDFARPQLIELKAFALPVVVATLLMWAQTQGYRFFIESWLGRDALARLAIGLGAALSIFASLEGFVAQFFFPDLYRSMDSTGADSKTQAWDLLVERIYTSYFLVFYACLATAPYILRVLLAEQYRDLTMIFALGIVLEMCRVLTNVAYLGTHAEWNPRRSLPSYLTGLIVVGLGLLVQYLTRDERLVMTAAVLAVGGFTTFVIMWLQVRRLIALRFPWKQALTGAALMLPLLSMQLWTDSSLPATLVKLAIAGVWTLFLLLQVQGGSGLRFGGVKVRAGPP